MTDTCEVEGCAQRTDQRLCAQKDEYEERLRLQEEDNAALLETRLRVQEEELTERLRVQKEECEERLQAQAEEHKKALLAQRDAIMETQTCYYGYYPLPLEDFPLEIIALIADFVDGFDDLARMSLTCHRLHNGVLLSRQWIVVEEIVAATAGDVKQQRRLLGDRGTCAIYACHNGLIRAVRALNLSRSEVTYSTLIEMACCNGHVEVLKYLHTTYALTTRELAKECSAFAPSMRVALAKGHVEVIRYLRAAGVSVPRRSLITVCRHGQLEMLKYLHTEVGFTAEDVRALMLEPLYHAIVNGYRDCVVYLHTGIGLTQDDARRLYPSTHVHSTMAKEVFELP